jgi:hypothetical protein
MSPCEKLLIIILRIFAGVTLTAIIPVCMPFAWMDVIHRALGLGPLPDVPITSYLARSLSGFYAMHGALLMYLSFDLKRNLHVIRLFIILGALFGFALLIIDLTAPLPLLWTLGEGPFVIALCAVLLYLIHRIQMNSST